jgi:hypothetical protein
MSTGFLRSNKQISRISDEIRKITDHTSRITDKSKMVESLERGIKIKKWMSHCSA